MRLFTFAWILAIGIFAFAAFGFRTSHFLRATGVSYFADKDGSETAFTVKDKKFFASSIQAIPPNAESMWVKIEVPRDLASWAEQPVLFTGSNELILQMEAFALREGLPPTLVGSCDLAMKDPGCDLGGRVYSFQIPKDAKYLLLRIRTEGIAIQNEFFFLPRTYYNRVNVFLTYFLGFSTGIYLLIAGIGLLAFGAVRRKMFLYFGTYALLTFFDTIIYRGIWDSIRLADSWPGGATLFIPVFFFTRFFELLFLQDFFEVKSHYRRLNLLFLSIMAILVLIIVTYVAGVGHAFLWKALPLILMGILGFEIAVLCYLAYEKNAHAIPLLIAWGAGLIGYLLWSVFHLVLHVDHWIIGYTPLMIRPIQFFLIGYTVLVSWRDMAILLGEARRREREGELIKTLFRTLSHDLANTTQVIEMSAKVAARSEDPNILRQKFQQVEQAVGAQVRIIKTVKEQYARRGDSIIDLKPVDLVDAVEQAAVLFESLMSAKGVHFVREYGPGAFMVMADSATLTHQVVANMLSNALKFTPAGKSVTVRMTREGEKGIALEISDEGIGMPDSLRRSLFLENAVGIVREGTANEKGTGKGMLIIRDFVAAFEAQIDVQSEEGRGTTCRILFKAAPS